VNSTYIKMHDEKIKKKAYWYFCWSGGEMPCNVEGLPN